MSMSPCQFNVQYVLFLTCWIFAMSTTCIRYLYRLLDTQKTYEFSALLDELRRYTQSTRVDDLIFWTCDVPPLPPAVFLCSWARLWVLLRFPRYRTKRVYTFEYSSISGDQPTVARFSAIFALHSEWRRFSRVLSRPAEDLRGVMIFYRLVIDVRRIFRATRDLCLYAFLCTPSRNYYARKSGN